MVRELTVTLDDELEKEMSKCPEINWADVVRKAIKECLRRKEIAEMYTAPVERAMLQEK